MRTLVGANTRLMAYCADIKNMYTELPHDTIIDAIRFALQHCHDTNRRACRRALTFELRTRGTISSVKHAHRTPPHMPHLPPNNSTRSAGLTSQMRSSPPSGSVFARSSVYRWAHRPAQPTQSACVCSTNAYSTSRFTIAATCMSPDAAPPQ